MAIGNAVQRGTLVYIYDECLKQTSSVSSTGCAPNDGLVGYTDLAVHIRKGPLVYAYNEHGQLLGKTHARFAVP